MPATDKFPKQDLLQSPARNAFEITPHDTNELTDVTKGVHCNVSGTAEVVFAGDSSAVTIEFVAGMTYPFRLKKVLSTGTDAGTELVGLY